MASSTSPSTFRSMVDAERGVIDRGIFERRYLEAQVMRFGGNISKTAGFVGMERSALHRKLRSLGIHTPDRP